MSDLVTWYEVTQNVRAMLRADYLGGHIDLDDDDAMEEYAHEWADADDVVIYYRHNRALWLDSAIVRGYEDETDGITADGSVDRVIMACVYLALRAEIMNAVEELREEIALTA